MAKKSQYILLHILGGLFFMSIPVLSLPDRDEADLLVLEPFLQHLLSYGLMLAFFYANYFYFIPKFYFSKQKFLFFAIAVAAYISIAVLPVLIWGDGDIVLLMQSDDMPPPFRPLNHHDGMHPPPHTHGGSFIQFGLVFSLSFFLRISQQLNSIQSEKLKTEVSYLKAQINPHFLFNTLNSLYALALEKSDAAPEAILKLSAMMRYVVTESSRDIVPLENELSYIRNYISLQQLRMDGGTAFSFISTGSPSGKNIPPMLLIPFIENAFKYGLNPEEDAAIAINIAIDENKLVLKVKNNKVHVAVTADEKTEQGIINTRQRLEYLFGERHELVIFEDENVFDVMLKLPFA